MVRTKKDKNYGKRRQPNHKAMDCKIILAVVHVCMSPHWCHCIVLSYFVGTSAQCNQYHKPQERERERERERQKRWQKHKGNKGMFCVASVWCYCAHLNVLSDLSLSHLSSLLPSAMPHSFAWGLLAPCRWGWLWTTASILLLLIHRHVTFSPFYRYFLFEN